MENQVAAPAESAGVVSVKSNTTQKLSYGELIGEKKFNLILDTAAKLNERDRTFLRMYYYEELPKPEIARVLGIKEERLRLIKSRALKRFAEIYSKLRRG